MGVIAPADDQGLEARDARGGPGEAPPVDVHADRPAGRSR